MRATIFIPFLLTCYFAYTQEKPSYLGKQILSADSVFIYSLPKVRTTNLSDSSCCDMLLYKDSFNVSVRLTLKVKTELGNNLIKPSGYVGRYASRSGFLPTEIIALWTKGRLGYIKVSRSTHDLFYSKGSTWVHIDPFDIDKLERFYKKYNINID